MPPFTYVESSVSGLQREVLLFEVLSDVDEHFALTDIDTGRELSRRCRLSSPGRTTLSGMVP